MSTPSSKEKERELSALAVEASITRRETHTLRETRVTSHGQDDGDDANMKERKGGAYALAILDQCLSSDVTRSDQSHWTERGGAMGVFPFYMPSTTGVRVCWRGGYSQRVPSAGSTSQCHA